MPTLPERVWVSLLQIQQLLMWKTQGPLSCFVANPLVNYQYPSLPHYHSQLGYNMDNSQYIFPDKLTLLSYLIKYFFLAKDPLYSFSHSEACGGPLSP